MSTNISKQKREALLNKIKDIRNFIAAAPQDENTGNLLSYLSDLEKDVNGKKYGLVFEEHREEIEKVLDTHAPVLTEDKDLFIDNGEQMNFLIEGDNLASLRLLEKTHKGQIDLIYIDPLYNTLKEGLSELSDENSERFRRILEIKIEEVLEKSQTVQEHNLIKSWIKMVSVTATSLSRAVPKKITPASSRQPVI